MKIRAILATSLLLATGCTGESERPSGIEDSTPAAELLRLEATDLPLEAGPGSAQPDLNQGADGRLYLSWIEADSEGAALRFATWEGDRWSVPLTIARGNNWFVNWADFPSVSATADGTLVAHWLQKSGPDTYAYDVRLSLSTDGGQQWSESLTPHNDGTLTEHGFVSIVPGRESFELIWLDGREMATGGHGADGHGSGSMTLRAATLSRDGSLSNERRIDDRVCECCSTDALRLEDDSILAIYRDRDDGEIRDIAVARREATEWSDGIAVADDGWQIAACPVNGPAAATAGERVAVAWFTAAGGGPAVQLAFSEDGGRSFGPALRVDDGRPRGRVDLELLEDGSAVVSWLEAGSLRLRQIGADRSAGPTWLVDETGESRAAGFPRLALHENGLFLAWTEASEAGTVKTVRVEFDALTGG